VKRTVPKEPTVTFSQEESLYEEQDVTGTINPSTFQQRSLAPETPGKRPVSYGDNATPQSFPPQPTSIPRPSTQRKEPDILLHRVLDRNYRLQATPLTTTRFTNRLPQRAPDATPTTTARNRTAQLLADDSIFSSPEPAAPELHAEIFSSPQRRPIRTPGVSVQTPPAKRNNKNKTPIKATASVWDDTEDDLDDDPDAFGQSPPKTMQFHIPQRRLLKTPGMFPLSRQFMLS
jgi:DASH complex subunit ASK1